MKGASKERKKFRAFAKALIIALVVFLAINFLIWHFFTKELLLPGSQVSDLVRLSYLVKIEQKRAQEIDLPKRHIMAGDYSGGKVDMVTVGDSFSLGGGYGRNPFYQDYIASYSNLKVINCPSMIDMGRPGYFTPVNTLAKLYNSGMLDRLKPRYVLLETVERYAADRLSSRFTFDDSESLDKLSAFYARYEPINTHNFKYRTFINTGNTKFIYYNVKDMFPVRKLNYFVYRAPLKQRMFSGEYGDRLYYYYDECTNGAISTNTVRAINDNLNLIADKLAGKNIKLVFMPVVSKSNLYNEYAGQPCNVSVFFEELRKLPKRYLFIDTKQLLQEAVHAGEKDIFYVDDTHWSWKASERIFRTVRFR